MLCIFSLAASIIFFFFLPIQKVLASSVSLEIDTGNGEYFATVGTWYILFFFLVGWLVGLAYQVKDIVFRFDYRV